MYFVVVALLMFALPLASIVIEGVLGNVALSATLVAKWYVFWAVGCRLLLAGMRQIVQPQYTARTILGLKSDESLLLVRELGFANIALGSLGVVSLFQPAWQLGAALAGGVFYGLAGINHACHANRNKLQTVAMISDVAASVVLLGTLALLVCERTT